MPEPYINPWEVFKAMLPLIIIISAIIGFSFIMTNKIMNNKENKAHAK